MSRISTRKKHGTNVLTVNEMIEGIYTLSTRTVKEVMVPRIDVAFIEHDMRTPELLDVIIKSGHSRFPVYKETIDNVLGILYAKDIIHYLGKEEKLNIPSLLRTSFFVPDSKKLDTLLREMQRKHVHIAIAVDEYGGVSGIVCLEDIIEEIVGEIQDEFDHEQEEILRIGEYTYICDARVNIDDLNEDMGIDLPNQNFDTLGGFVFDLFDKIPACFEKVTYESLDFIVQEIEGRIIKKVKIIVHNERQHTTV